MTPVSVQTLTRNPLDTVMFSHRDFYHIHLSAIFEWMISINLEVFELSYAAEFFFFSSFMLSNLLPKQEEEKPLMLTLT